jgi:type 1 glutamine amidotransferase
MAGLACAPVLNAQDWARIRSGAEQTLSFKVAIPLTAFRLTFAEALAQLGPLQVKNVEAFSTQQVRPDLAKTLGPGLNATEIAAVKSGLRGQRLTAYSVSSIGPDETAARELFQFASDLKIETIISAPAPEGLSLIDKLAAEFNVNVAVANGGNPVELRKLLEAQSARIGVCADLEQWRHAGIKPLEGLAALGDRLMAVRLRDSGAAETKDFFLALHRRKARPVLFTFDAAALPDPVTVLSARLDAYETALIPVMTEYVNELGRTTAIRTIDAQTHLTEEEKAGARRKMDAAMPSRPKATPRKPRKLLVIDLQVGYPGHPSIPYANYVLDRFGKKTGAWKATFSNDLTNFRYDQLRRFDAIFLNNTVGMLFPDPEARAAIVRYLKDGGGLIGYHASTHASIDWPEFTEIIGASSGGHREATEKVTVKLDDAASPINAAFAGREFESIDEHFRWTNFSRQRVHVLLSIDVPKSDMNQGRGCNICTRADNDYAISWIRSYGKGRVFYTSLGHAPGAFMDQRILGQMLAGIQFALGDLDADTTPGNQPAN